MAEEKDAKAIIARYLALSYGYGCVWKMHFARLRGIGMETGFQGLTHKMLPGRSHMNNPSLGARTS